MDVAIMAAGALLCGAAGFAASRGIITLLERLDNGIIEHGADRRAGLAASALACLLSCMGALMGGGWPIWALSVPFWASLSGAAYSDGLTKEIYDCVYYPGILGSALMLWISSPGKAVLVDLGIFLVLQFALFRLMYGMSDCIAFSMCALFLAVHGCGLLEMMAVMLLTLVLFVVWHFLSKNVHLSRSSIREGTFMKLKEPDAMIPYIYGAMGIVMACMALPMGLGLFLFGAAAVAVLVFL